MPFVYLSSSYATSSIRSSKAPFCLASRGIWLIVLATGKCLQFVSEGQQLVEPSDMPRALAKKNVDRDTHSGTYNCCRMVSNSLCNRFRTQQPNTLLTFVLRDTAQTRLADRGSILIRKPIGRGHLPLFAIVLSKDPEAMRWPSREAETPSEF